MSKNTRWTPEDMRKAGMIEVEGKGFVKASSQVVKKPDKLPNLLERALLQVPQTVPTPKANKIRNAKKIEQDGIKFASRLELYLYNLLKENHIEFEFQKVFTLQKAFRYRGQSIRDIRVIIDFWLPKQRLLVDSKGWQLADGKIKYKMLKYRLVAKFGEYAPDIEMPSTQTQCRELVARIKAGEFL